MREKLNNNPVYQAVFIGVLALGVGLMLMMRMSGGSEPTDTAAPPPATDPAAAAAGAPDPNAVTVVGGDPSAAAATPSAPAVSGTATPPPTTTGAPFKAGPGLPAEVVAAYDGGQAVGLLIVNHRGIDDRDLVQMVSEAGSRADVAVFVTDVKNVADYSRITEGVELSRTPALVLIRPKRLTQGPTPEATIAYGFRGPASVQQAFDDVLYAGPDNLPAYP